MSARSWNRKSSQNGPWGSPTTKGKKDDIKTGRERRFSSRQYTECSQVATNQGEDANRLATSAGIKVRKKGGVDAKKKGKKGDRITPARRMNRN